MKNHKRGLPCYVKNTSTTVKLQMCFFIAYLLKIITSIIKANTIIVSKTKPYKSKYIISNKTASIIAPPPFSQLKLWIKSGKPHLLILISYKSYYTIYFTKKQYFYIIFLILLLSETTSLAYDLLLIFQLVCLIIFLTLQVAYLDFLILFGLFLLNHLVNR